ncbi:MAG TPA: NAD(P)/FAD-dependent oxidoreductase [Streptosporangiaceae bacterium]|nr:NAD(P)/FAD-dependent oxidoreductase [Streptosporangiaceae bacterium]
MNENESYDVVVVGGGAAGLSGAVALARSRRSVLVIDAGDPRNAPAGHVHNFLSRDGTPPSELLAAGRTEVRRYGGRVETGRVTALARDGERFGVQIGQRTVTARRLLVATGLRDVLPDVPGLAARWGIDVLHCPYCHGWEVRDQRVGILSTGPAAVHQALLFQQLSPHVTLLRHTGPAPDAEQRTMLEALGVAIADGEVEQVEADASGLTGVVLAGRGHLPLDAVVVAPRLEARAGLLEPLGLKPAEVLIGEYPVGTRVEADRTGATAVPGVWVAGNLTDPQAQVMGAAAAGLMAGAAINLDLVLEQARSRG